MFFLDIVRPNREAMNEHIYHITTLLLVGIIRVILIGEVFSHNFHIIFAKFFTLPYFFPDFFSQICETSLFFFASSAEFHD